MPSLQELLSRSVVQNLGLSDLIEKRKQEAEMMGQNRMRLADLEAQNINARNERDAALGQGIGSTIGGTLGAVGGFFVGGPAGAVSGAKMGSQAGGSVGREGLSGLAKEAPNAIIGAASDFIAKDEAKKLENQKTYTSLAEKDLVPAKEGEAQFQIPINGQQTGFKKLLKPSDDVVSAQGKQLFSDRLGIPVEQLPNSNKELGILMSAAQKDSAKKLTSQDMIQDYSRLAGMFNTNQAIPSDVKNTYQMMYKDLPNFLPLPKVGTKQPEKVENKAFDIGSVLTKGTEDLKNDSTYKTAAAQLSSVKELKGALNLENPLVSKTFPLTVRKVAGDTGNSGEREQAAVAIFGGLTDQANQFFTSLESGKIAPEQLKYLKQYVDFYEKLGNEKLRSSVEAKKASLKAAYRGSISEEQIDSTFKSLYPTKSEVKKQIKNNEFIEGKVYQVTFKGGKTKPARYVNGRWVKP